MTTVMTHEPSTDKPDRQGVAARLLVPGFWGAQHHRDVARRDVRRHLRRRHGLGDNAGGGPRVIPSAVLLGLFAVIGTVSIAKRVFGRRDAGERFRDGSAIRAMRQPGGHVRPHGQARCYPWSSAGTMTTGQRVWWLTWVLGDPISSRANPSVPRDQNPCGVLVRHCGSAAGRPVGSPSVAGVFFACRESCRPRRSSGGRSRPRSGCCGHAMAPWASLTTGWPPGRRPASQPCKDDTPSKTPPSKSWQFNFCRELAGAPSPP